MCELTKDELGNWRSQFGTSQSIKTGLLYPPMAFAEDGAIMVANVLRNWGLTPFPFKRSLSPIYVPIYDRCTFSGL